MRRVRMTDHELTALVASIAEAQKKTDEQIKETGLQLKETDKQLKETDKQIKETGLQLKETDKRLQETDKLLAKTSARIDKVIARVDKVAAKVDKVAIMYGGMANNQGAVAEEFYFNTLKDNPVLQNMHFDITYKNVTAQRAGIEDEYDILLINGTAIYIIEVKYNVHAKDIKKLIDKKAKNFRVLFPEYTDYEHHLGLACFHIDDDTKEQALAAGVNILQRKGTVIEAVACEQYAA